MRGKTEVTIKDIAKKVNLSPSTVSRALSGSRHVDDKTRSKISEVADDLGYRRTPATALMRSRESLKLGVVVTHLNLPFASNVISGVESIATAMGYAAILNQSLNKPEVRGDIPQRLRHQNVDGVLVASAYHQEHESLNELIKLNKPVVVLEASSLMPTRSRKKVDDYQNAYELTSYLIEAGCRRITCISVDVTGMHQGNFIRGYQDSLNDHNIMETEKVIVNSAESRDAWPEVCQAFDSVTIADGIIFSNNTIMGVALRPAEFAKAGDLISVTCRKGSVSMQTKIQVELGKLAAALLICLSQKNNNTPYLKQYTRRTVQAS